MGLLSFGEDGILVFMKGGRWALDIGHGFGFMARSEYLFKVALPIEFIGTSLKTDDIQNSFLECI